MNHKAIYKIYPQVVTVDDGAGAFDKDGNKVEIDMALVDAWKDPEAYKYARAAEYPPIGDQLDALWKGGAEAEAMLAKVQAVKQKFPKGSSIMPSTINATLTNGVAIQGDNSGALALQTNNGTTAVTIDTSQNVGVGSASSGNKFEVAGSGVFSGAVTTNTTGTHISYQSSNSQIGAWGPDTSTNGTLVFFSARSNGVNGVERMRITAGGDLCVGKTSTALATVGFGVASDGSTLITKTHADSGGAQLYLNRLNVNGPAVYFYKDTSNVGNISVTGSATSYNSGSDYRLKDNIQPLTNALDKVAQLKPSTWAWKIDGTYGDGFVAHELAEVCPNAVTGEKDAVNEDGSIRPQGVDTSFLVATLTAAIQELNAKVEAQAVRIAELEGAK
jgi:Chaperone of endosialidase